MLNTQSVSMVSALAGLRRIEAQIYQAMIRAGAPEALDQTSEAGTDPNNLMNQANLNMVRAETVIDGLDLKA